MNKQKNYNQNKLIEILDFLNEYTNKPYRNPENENDPVKKELLKSIKSKGCSALAKFKDMCIQLDDENYKNKISHKWLNGRNTLVRNYLWSELKHKDKKDLPSSISIFAEKESGEVRFRISLEIRVEDSDEEAYMRHNRFLHSFNVNEEEFEYFGTRNKDINLENLSKEGIKEYIQEVKDRKANKIQVGKTIDYDFVKNNTDEDIIKIMKNTIEKLKKYYEIAVSEGEEINMNKNEEKCKISKNTILYGPPGTGKTFNVANKALEIIDYEKYKDIINDSSKREEVVKEFNKIKEDGLIGFCTFHQSYSYEDFVEGLRSDGNGGFEPKDGIFKQICKDASIKAQKELPKYDFDEEKINVHKMSLGDTSIKDDNIIFDYCIENNCISLGYGKDINYSGCNDREAVKEKLKNNSPDIKDNDFNITAMNRFKNTIKEGDIIIVSSGNLKVRAIAKVIGDYYYDSNTEIPYNHFRKVEWLYNGDFIDVKMILKEKRFSQATIYAFNNNDLKFDNIKELISCESNEDINKNYVLIIDEINRGNISKIFGELITLIECDKRIGEKNEIKVTLPYSNESFGVPSNLYIIGTMNTADRSIALLDTALRRRFEFTEYMPKEELLPNNIDGINVCRLLKNINDRIEFLFDRDHKIGHAYFIKDDLGFDDIVSIMKNKIIPLLQEYFYDDFEKIALILGGSGEEGDNNCLLNKKIIKAEYLFKNKLSNIYPDKVKYSVVENPTKEAFINIYSDIKNEYIDNEE